MIKFDPQTLRILNPSSPHPKRKITSLQLEKITNYLTKTFPKS